MNDTGLMRFSLITPSLPTGIVRRYISEIAVTDARVQIMMVIQSYAMEKNRQTLENLTRFNLTEPIFDETAFNELISWIKASLIGLLEYIQKQNYHEAAYLTALNEAYKTIEKAFNESKESLLAAKMVYDIPCVGILSKIVFDTTIPSATKE